LLKETKNSMRIIIRDENETLGKKIRNGEAQKIPYLLIVGKQERGAKTMSARIRSKGDIGQQTISQFVKRFERDIKKGA